MSEYKECNVVCEVCGRIARYQIRDVGTGKWLEVCVWHDDYIGIKNLKTFGYDQGQARAITKGLKVE